MPSATVNTSGGTSFSEMKAAYVNAYNTSAAGNSYLRDGKTVTPISMSYFRNATFTNPYGASAVPSSGAISVEDDFLYEYYGTNNGKTF